MIITCPACSTRYDVPEGSIGSEGRTVRCAQCRHSWYVPGPEGSDELEPQPAEVQPAEVEADDVEPAEVEAAVEHEAGLAAPLAEAPPAEAIAATPPARADEPKPAPEPPVYADDPGERYRDEMGAGATVEPPVRRSRLRNWLLALLLFVLVALGIGAAIAFYGPPDWLPMQRTAFGEPKPGLKLDFPPDRIDRRTLANGTEFFGARGTITNVGQSRQAVPPILIVLRDRQKRVVYRWEVVPPKRHLAPGESITINEAVTDIPPTAIAPEIGWKAV